VFREFSVSPDFRESSEAGGVGEGRAAAFIIYLYHLLVLSLFGDDLPDKVFQFHVLRRSIDSTVYAPGDGPHLE
jgi:hypothetical protein